MHVRVIPFGVLKDRLSAATLELPTGATVGELLERLIANSADGLRETLRGIAVGVNAEYATPAQVLHEGDEVGLLPPVSGGAAPAASALDSSREREDKVVLTRDYIDSSKLIAEIKCGEDGAVAVFDGIVRNHSRGRSTLHLDYEAYEEMALGQMRQLAGQARQRFGVRQVTLIHRLGRLEIGETSVLIVVASAHRAAAFDACRWLIDTLKTTVPIGKKETFTDGAVWAPGEPFPADLAVQPAETKHEP
jgi:molybdopterin synthase catalytic subunit/molybdopterin converting factor small subunit